MNGRREAYKVEAGVCWLRGITGITENFQPPKAEFARGTDNNFLLKLRSALGTRFLKGLY